MFSALITIAGGILAASSYIIAKKPNAKELIDKMVPYQGWIGVVLFVWGIFDLLSALRLFSFGFGYGLVALVASAAELLIGFILGFSLISKYALSKNAEALKKGEELRMKLTKIQIPLGFVAIGLGVLYLLFIWGIVRF